MKKLLSCFLIITLFFTMQAVPVFAFDDTEEHWAGDIIQGWLDKGWLDGNGDFRPDAPVTRAEFVDFIFSAFDLQPEDEAFIYFTDVTEENWYYDAIMAVAGAGYIGGYPDGTFGPDDTITREEAAVILCKISGSEQAPDDAENFSDSELLEWSKGYVGACVGLGILTGDADGSFRPQDNMTRAEAITCLDSLRQFVNEQEEVVTEPILVQPSSVATVNITSSVYGPADNILTVTQKATVSSTSNTTTLQNMVIKGDLIVQKGVKNLELVNVKVTGSLILNGATTVTLENSEIDHMSVENFRNSITINVKDQSVVYQTDLITAATLNDNNGNSNKGFKDVTVCEDADKKTSYIFRGDFTSVTVEAPHAYLYLKEGSIKELTLYSDAQHAYVELSRGTSVREASIYAKYAEIAGSGRIYWAYIGASNITLAKRPDSVSGSYTAGYGSKDSSYKYTYTVKVVNSNGVAVPQAEVYIDGSYYTTDSSGEVTLKLYSGDYNYKIYHDGFYTKSGTISVSKSSSATFRLESKYQYTVTIQVWDDYGAVENAAVTLDNITTLTTNNNGMVTFYGVDAGTYRVSVSCSGYYSNTDTITVNTDINQAVSLTKREIEPQTGTAVLYFKDQNTGALVTTGLTVNGQPVLEGVYLFNGTVGKEFSFTANAPGYEMLTISGIMADGMEETYYFTLANPGAVKFLLINEEEEPLTGYELLGSYLGPNGYSGSIAGASAAEGVVIGSLAPGDYTYILAIGTSENKEGAFTVTEGTTTVVSILVQEEEAGEEPGGSQTPEPPAPDEPEVPGGSLEPEDDGGLEGVKALIPENNGLVLPEEKETLQPEAAPDIQKEITEPETIQDEIIESISEEETLKKPETEQKPESSIQENKTTKPETGSVTFTVSGLQQTTATVSIGGNSYQTRGGAVVAANLPVGNYRYSVSANGYESVSGSVNVSRSGTAVSVTMKKIATEENGNQQRQNTETEAQWPKNQPAETQPAPAVAETAPIPAQSSMQTKPAGTLKETPAAERTPQPAADTTESNLPGSPKRNGNNKLKPEEELLLELEE